MIAPTLPTVERLYPVLHVNHVRVSHVAYDVHRFSATGPVSLVYVHSQVLILIHYGNRLGRGRSCLHKDALTGGAADSDQATIPTLHSLSNLLLAL